MESAETQTIHPKIKKTTRRVMLWVCLCSFTTIILVSSMAYSVKVGVRSSRGSQNASVTISFHENESVLDLSDDLLYRGIIGSKWSFLYFLYSTNQRTKLQAGDYVVSGTLSIPEIVSKFVHGETVNKGIKVTFPEGMTAQEMATRLNENGFSGDDFLRVVRRPDPSFRAKYPFLADAPTDATLEGFLFPDTYYLDPASGADGVLSKLLDGYAKRVVPVVSGSTGQVRYHTIVLASVVEMEVRTDTDRKIVADIFQRRIAAGMPLQSDATVRYALGVTKVKHSLTDIAVDSPYNTYMNKGLPPGPISNPGLSSILAVLNPTPNRYLYFLNNPDTGQTVFSETFEEHVANKAKNGL